MATIRLVWLPQLEENDFPSNTSRRPPVSCAHSRMTLHGQEMKYPDWVSLGYIPTRGRQNSKSASSPDFHPWLFNETLT